MITYEDREELTAIADSLEHLIADLQAEYEALRFRIAILDDIPEPQDGDVHYVIRPGQTRLDEVGGDVRCGYTECRSSA